MLVAALAFAGCGSEGGAEAAEEAMVNDTMSSSVADATTTVVEEATTSTTAAAETTIVEGATTTGAAGLMSVDGAPADRVMFVGPQRSYTLWIGPDWDDASAEFGEGVAGWFTGEVSVGFAETVNIVTDSVPSATPLTAILTASLNQIESQFEGFTLLASEVVTRPGQPDVGFLEYSALQADIEIRFVQVFGVWNDTLVVLTGSTDGRLGAEGVDRLRPYALTLAPAS